MEKQPFVPNQFFDIFARMVPGAALILALRLLTGRDVQTPVLRMFVPASLEDQVVPWLIVMVTLTYTLGHLLSPLVKGLDAIGRVAKPKWLLEHETERYNRLRFKYAATLTVATRIRAEYTMYGAIAAALVIAELVLVKRWLSSAAFSPANVTWSWHAATAVICACLIFRYYDVHQRFCKTLSGFEAAAEEVEKAKSANDPIRQPCATL